jgi:hypothetical protein
VAVTIRPCRVSDIPAVLDLWARSADASVGVRAMGAARVSCLVFNDNRRARAFWSSRGYEHDGETVRYKKDL